jgi:hypothetical protein
MLLRISILIIALLNIQKDYKDLSKMAILISKAQHNLK